MPGLQVLPGGKIDVELPATKDEPVKIAQLETEHPIYHFHLIIIFHRSLSNPLLISRHEWHTNQALNELLNVYGSRTELVFEVFVVKYVSVDSLEVELILGAFRFELGLGGGK